ncbi:MAG: diguanylate cyclase [Armatimonadetes bacterium]|nr:diguanylate cyclase [Armatimonadota bacterium]
MAALLHAFPAEAEQYRLLFDENPMPMFVYDIECLRFLAVNKAAAEHYGYSRDEFLSMTIKEIRPPEEIPPLLRDMATVATGLDLTRERRHRKKDGTIIDVEMTAHTVTFDGRPARLVLAVDVTGRRRAEAAQARMTAILEATTDFVRIADAQGRIIYRNRALRDLLGIAEEDARQAAIGERQPAWARDIVLNVGIPTAIREGSWSGETAFLHRDGREVPVSQVILAHRAPDGTVEFFSSIARDISEHKRLAEELAYLADHDSLTGLFNRRRLLEEMELQLARSRRYDVHGALLFLDLDQFKIVNDSLGHPVGDKLLARLAGLLHRRLRETDILARLGGDEFAILLPHTDVEQAQAVARHLLETLRQHTVLIDGHPVHITTSIGIALFPEHGITTDALLAHADVAMYMAKESGRDRFAVYTPDATLRSPLASRLTRENLSGRRAGSMRRTGCAGESEVEQRQTR